MEKMLKSSITVFLLFLFFTLLSVQVSAQSVTTKFKVVNNITKLEMFPVGDVKGHIIGVLSRGGLALFENDEVANQSAVMSFESTLGKGGTFEVYTTITFSDGSSWIIKSTGSMERTPDQKKLLTKQKGEFLNGSGKYEGIKGTVSINGIQYGPAEVGKGEWIGEFTVTYTLPKK